MPSCRHRALFGVLVAWPRVRVKIRGEPGWEAGWMVRQEHGDEQAVCGLGTGPRPMDELGLPIVVTWVRSGSP